MNRRSFLGFAPVALLPGWRTRSGARSIQGSCSEKAEWWTTVETLNDYELLASTADAEGMLIEWCNTRPSYEVDFFDSNYPVSKPLSISAPGPNPEFLVEGPVSYRISIFGLHQSSDRNVVVLLFDRPAAVRIYVSVRGPKQILALTSEPEKSC